MAEDKGSERNYRRKKAAAVVAVVVIIAAIGAGFLYQQEQERKAAEQARIEAEHNEAVYAVFESYESEMAAAASETELAKPDMLTRLDDLDELRSSIEAGKEKLRLYDGSYYGYDELLADIAQEKKAICGLVMADYEQAYAENTAVVADQTAGKEALEKAETALRSLLSDVESEKQYGIWPDDADYAAFVDEVTGSLDAVSERLAEIESAEQQRVEQERPANSASSNSNKGSAAVSGNSGGASSNNDKSDGDVIEIPGWGTIKDEGGGIQQEGDVAEGGQGETIGR